MTAYKIVTAELVELLARYAQEKYGFTNRSGLKKHIHLSRRIGSQQWFEFSIAVSDLLTENWIVSYVSFHDAEVAQIAFGEPPWGGSDDNKYVPVAVQTILSQREGDDNGLRIDGRTPAVKIFEDNVPRLGRGISYVIEHCGSRAAILEEYENPLSKFGDPYFIVRNCRIRVALSIALGRPSESIPNLLTECDARLRAAGRGSAELLAFQRFDEYVRGRFCG